MQNLNQKSNRTVNFKIMYKKNFYSLQSIFNIDLCSRKHAIYQLLNQKKNNATQTIENSLFNPKIYFIELRFFANRY